MKKVNIITSIDGVKAIVVNERLAQCPFKNTYVLANTEKVKTAETPALVAHPQYCNELCPFFELRDEKSVFLSCTGSTVALHVDPMPEQPKKNPLNIVN